MMKSFLISTVTLLAYLLGCLNVLQAMERPILNNLKQLEWQHRIIIVNNSASSLTSESRLLAKQTEIDERNIIWFVLTNNANKLTVASNFQGQLSTALNQQLLSFVIDKASQVVLIGKDGSVKSRSEFLELQNIFEQIDAMPMRILEMQNN